VAERAAVALRPGSVRIAVAASGVNFADVMARIGVYPDAPRPPCVLGYEVAGTVTECAEGVERLSVGQRVMAATQFGGYASEVVVAADDALALPERLSFEQGAAVPINYATAWAALIGYGALRTGDRVLVHAAAGGVGIAATALAKRHGAEVYGTASPGKHERLRALGADHAIDYTRSGWETGLPKFDLILDSRGGASFRRSYGQLRPGGRLIAFGTSAFVTGERRNFPKELGTVLRMPRISVLGALAESKTVTGLNLLLLWRDRGTLAPWLDPLRQFLDDGTIEPELAGRFGFEQAAQAHRMLSERRNVGKVVLVPAR